MRRLLSLLLIALAPCLLYAQFQYPSTKKVEHVDEYHGTKVPDPYRWLEDDNAADTKAWVQEQNKVTFDYLNKIPYRAQWRKRIEEVYNYAKYSAPFRNGEYYYFYKNNGLQNQSVLYRQKGLDGEPQMVIDPNTLSKDGTTIMTTFSISRNGKYAVYGLSRGGSDWQTYYVRNMETNQDLGDELKWVKVSGIGWQDDGFYYSRYPEPEQGKELSSKNENHQIYFHKVGTPQSEDKLMYEDKANPQRFHIAFTSEDLRYTYLTISDRGKGLSGNALWYKDKKRGDEQFKPLIKDVGKYVYNIVDNIDGKFLVRTNHNAPNYKLILIDPNHTEESAWTTFLEEKAEPMQGAGTAGGKLFVNYLKDVTTRIYVYNLNGKMEQEVKLPGLGTAGGFGGWSTDKFVFYTFNSFTVPPTIYRYDIATGKTSVFRQPEIAAFNPNDYETKQVFYPSKDGVKVPMFLVYKKGLQLNGKNPVILYGYGGFNISSLPGFSATLVPWLEQAGVYALANLRGGAEYGEKWHEAGMRLKKQTVFDDFIAAAEYLINSKYTSKDYLSIRGGSNGGLLVGAVMNQRPDLFKVAIPQVGVMDMLRFHKFTIGWNWIAEYGSSDNPEDFKNLYAYSPLHNLKPGVQYPATLITTADHDDRVVPAHSFKYAATIQEMHKGSNPVLIRIETNSGHGASNTAKAIDLTSDIYSFTFYNMGLKPNFDNLYKGNPEKKKPF
ncbi:MAG TPA: prolyl oligopeptidase family serine peptidase [Chitinophagaceae bacterium]|nr:prolyl oligopeptidase family serine peptidase [Chitinophagaceae bacterium]